MYSYADIEKQKQDILSSKTSPIQILVDVFKLCENDCEANDIQTKDPILFNLLNAFCIAPDIYTNNITSECVELVAYVWHNKDLVRKYDIHLFYALLGFLDYLKQKQLLGVILKKVNT